MILTAAVAAYFVATVVAELWYRAENGRSVRFSIEFDDWWIRRRSITATGQAAGAAVLVSGMAWTRRRYGSTFGRVAAVATTVATAGVLLALPFVQLRLLESRYLSMLETSGPWDTAAALATIGSRRAPDRFVAAIIDGQVGGYRAAEALWRFPDGPGRVKALATDTRTPAHARFTAALAWYAAARRDGTPPQAAISVIEAMLVDAEPRTREIAIERLHEPFRDDVFASWRTPLFLDASPQVRRRLLKAADIGCTELTLLFDDVESDVRAEALRQYERCSADMALTEGERSRRIARGLTQITLSSPDVRWSAAFDLAMSGHETGTAWMLRFLRDEAQNTLADDQRTLAALMSLARGSNEAVVPILWTVGTCPTRRPSVRTWALGELYAVYVRHGGTTARPPAEYRLNSPTPAPAVSGCCRE